MYWRLFTQLPFGQHLVTSIVLRLILIVYGEFHDSFSEVPFTDIDYKVVTDGARHLQNGHSPFQRHTYRYTPLLAYSLLPNLFLHKSFGKVLFSIFDLLIGILIRAIIRDEFGQTFYENATALLKKNKRLEQKRVASKTFALPPKYEQIATHSALAWLYNPMSMVIATRGNGDSITSFFVLATIHQLQKAHTGGLKNVLAAGVMHGLAIHFRLYPIAFSLAYYLYLAERKAGFWSNLLQPSMKQFLLAFSTVGTLTVFTAGFYLKFGYEFLYEAYLYHLVRKDIRHNFSLYFYMNYLNPEPFLFEKVLTFLPQLIILLLICLQFGQHRKTLSFCVFLQAFVMVIFNPVVTSKYFVWFLALLPVCLKNLKGHFGTRRAISYGIL